MTIAFARFAFAVRRRTILRKKNGRNHKLTFKPVNLRHTKRIQDCKKSFTTKQECDIRPRYPSFQFYVNTKIATSIVVAKNDVCWIQSLRI